jgi:hypothetical protein
MSIDTEYLEIYFEIVVRIGQDITKPYNNVANQRYEAQGRGGLYELAQELTDEFQEKFKDHQWDGDFFDEIESFLNEKNKQL